MKFLKSLFSFTIPLVFVLIVYVIYGTLSSLVQTYKQNIINDYAIIIVTDKALSVDTLKAKIDFNIESLENLKREDILMSLKDKLSSNSLDILKQKLPYFYKIHLDDFPTQLQLKNIRNTLGDIAIIKRVETFSSDYDKIYSLLFINEKVFQAVLLFILIFAIIILIKQVKIWFFEHDKKISIIQYYGGSIFYGATPMIRLAIISFILSSLIVIGLTYLAINNLILIITPEMLSIIPKNFIMKIDYVGIFVVAFLVSSIPIIGVLMKHKTK